MSPGRAAALLAGVAAAGIAVLAWQLGTGGRYRLYSSEQAGDCWRVLQLTTPGSSRIEPVRVGAPARSPQGHVRVTIGYTMDRVLGGGTLEVVCAFGADGRLATVEFDGGALDAESLEAVNSALYGE